ncbi:helix-turn-helix domain-containing protein [Kytococcus sedentarius]|uniref:helix-turn-helix domain-containing protein n=1 Tax=Kytococcus sedentarius TaxID=1276 RepID=UPI00387992C6
MNTTRPTAHPRGDDWLANYNARRPRENQLIDGIDAALAINTLRARGWYVRQLAELAGCPENTLTNVVKGRAKTITRGRSTILVAAAALGWTPGGTEGVTP